MINKLVDSIYDQQKFWESVHREIPSRKHNKNDISTDEWFRHFKVLLETEPSRDQEDLLDGEEEEIDNIFDRPITAEEIMLALRKLKSKKAAGTDKIIGELLKYASDFVLPFFVKFLNRIFDRGLFPIQWTESIILPLFKKGNVNEPGNYRGISLCNISSKIYSFIINKRLQQWVEENNCTGEWQAGFKRGYSTTDHMFTLMACIQKQFSLNRKLYVAFIDFEKCFDSINRNILWQVLLKNGVKGKLLRCLRSMYCSVKARVRCGSELSQTINCTAGVKQGDSCSPILCSLFINELALEIIRKGRHGVTFMIEAFELFILLLADDIALQKQWWVYKLS